MLQTKDQLRAMLAQVLADRAEQGHVTDGLADSLANLPDSYDAMVAFGRTLHDLPMRDDWPYVEPSDLDAVRAESATDRATTSIGMLREAERSSRIAGAFRARVAGCMLGKPFEIDITLDEIRQALTPHGEWPLNDYASEAALRSLPTLQGQWRELARERICFVAPDDDINYTILAMLALEHHGSDFTHDDLRALWLYNLPVLATFGPERTVLVSSAIDSIAPGSGAVFPQPHDEYCGALIRADAYGYACLGNPELACELAWRDASLTHRRTGIYGAMFVAAAIAIAPFVGEPMEIFRRALGYVPQRSRFAASVNDAIDIVEGSNDWLTAYDDIHLRFGEFGHCRIHQEIGTLVNAVVFASDVGDGICKQVMQGNDTDSFGATAGSILGAHLGIDALERRWYEPFNDDVHTALALFHERSLDAITDRMTRLPERIGDSS